MLVDFRFADFVVVMCGKWTTIIMNLGDGFAQHRLQMDAQDTVE